MIAPRRNARSFYRGPVRAFWTPRHLSVESYSVRPWFPGFCITVLCLFLLTRFN